MSPEAPYDLVVIGAGFAGLSTATTFERAHPAARVLVLEAGDRIGGRARSFEGTGGDRPGHALDAGAHYFGKHHRRVTALAERLVGADAIHARPRMYGANPAFRILLQGTWRSTTQKESFFELQGLDRSAPLADRLHLLASMCLYLGLEALVDTRAPWRTPFAKRLDAKTFASWIAEQELPPWLGEMWHVGSLGLLSAPAERISMLYWLWYHAANASFLVTANDFAGGAQECFVECGLGGLALRFAREVRGEVRLRAAVCHVDHTQPDRVRVRLASGDEIEARHVVVAVTPNAAGRHLTFDPPLHPARARIHAQPMGHAAKCVASFDEVFWRDEAGNRYYGFSGGPGAAGAEWALDTSHPAGGQVSLTTFVGPGWFADGAPPTDEAAAAALRGLTGFPVTGPDGSAAPTRARGFSTFRWADLPYVGGGPNTVFGPDVLSHAGPVFDAPEGARVHFAAAEYSTTFPGYVEGALASGERVAARIGAADAHTAPALPEGRGPRWVLGAACFAAYAVLRPLARLASWLGGRRTGAPAIATVAPQG